MLFACIALCCTAVVALAPSTPPSAPPLPLEAQCRSVGDPHITTFPNPADGFQYDQSNHDTGWQVLYQEGNVLIEAIQDYFFDLEVVNNIGVKATVDGVVALNYSMGAGHETTNTLRGDPLVVLSVRVRQWGATNYMYQLFLTADKVDGATGQCTNYSAGMVLPDGPGPGPNDGPQRRLKGEDEYSYRRRLQPSFTWPTDNGGIPFPTPSRLDEDQVKGDCLVAVCDNPGPPVCFDPQYLVQVYHCYADIMSTNDPALSDDWLDSYAEVAITMVAIQAGNFPPSAPPSAPPAPGASVTGDPHHVGADGDRFDFKGANNTVYAVHSSHNLAFNALYMYQTFVMGGVCPLCTHKTVHGSYIKAVYVRAATATGLMTVLAEYRADEPSHAQLTVQAAADVPGLHDSRHLLVDAKKPDAIEEAFEEVKVRLARKHSRAVAFTVSNDEYEVGAENRYLAWADQNSKSKRIDVFINPRKSVALLAEKVAPHGLIGQTFDADGWAVDGRLDDYSAKVVTTEAMGEGAIEGSATDYVISRADPFSSAFKYSRFASVRAAPRDISKLSGLHRKVSGAPVLSGGAGTRGDDQLEATEALVA